MTEPDQPVRPRGPTYDLPVGKVLLQLGQQLEPKRLLSGWYDFEVGYYRRQILRELVGRYRMWAYKNPRNWHQSDGERRALVPGHKDAIRRAMGLVDNAYSAEVCGVRLVTSQNEGNLANQCYVGDGSSGAGGSIIMYAVLWRGQTPDGNHQAVVFKQRWQQGTAVLAAHAHQHPDLPYAVAQTEWERKRGDHIRLEAVDPRLGRFRGAEMKEMSALSRGEW